MTMTVAAVATPSSVNSSRSSPIDSSNCSQTLKSKRRSRHDRYDDATESQLVMALVICLSALVGLLLPDLPTLPTLPSLSISLSTIPFINSISSARSTPSATPSAAENASAAPPPNSTHLYKDTTTDATPLRLTHADFPFRFATEVLHTLAVDPAVAPLVAAHDIFQDERYTLDPVWYDEWRQKAGWMLDDGLKDDNRLSVRWVGEENRYGLVADMPVSKNSVVAVVGGVVTNATDASFLWTYPSEILDADGRILELGIAVQEQGNWAQFVAHDPKPNCDVVLVPHNNLWHIMYVSNRLILPGEEVTVAYWSDEE
ncbi:hypothetical protein DFJ73DRAFT_922478 [Zopfochytrium polystomum]|nr:hypothetical protein DFJ73DRAFT_922478 [Zopfochytrium polystomum]